MSIKTDMARAVVEMDRKQENLQENQEIYRIMADFTPDLALLRNPDSSVRYISSNCLALTGYTDREFLALPQLLDSIIHPEDSEVWKHECRCANLQQSGTPVDLRLVTKDGEARWFNYASHEVTDANGDYLGVRSSFRDISQSMQRGRPHEQCQFAENLLKSTSTTVKEDITSRKEAERLLQKKQAELVLKHEQLTNLFLQVEQGKREWEQTMDCIDDMVAMVDNERRIRRCNRAFMNFVGCPYPKLISTDWCALLRSAGLDIDGLEGFSGELVHAPSQRWLTLKTYSYDEGRGEVITLQDLTEIKLVSQQLSKAYQELKSTHSQLLQQEKMASVGQLAAGVAHEINNPMGFISSNLGTMEKYLQRLTGFLELQYLGIERNAPEELREEIAEARRRFKVDYILGDARSLLAESKDGAERVRTIVQNLKNFSRIDEAQATHVDLNECLESTVTIAWNELKYKATLNRDYGELPQVKCRPQQLNQVFLNMLVNAAHAIEKQGMVTIRTRQENDQVTVAIHDTGCGIPEGIRTRIFEPFFTTKEAGKGTGLGLSISYDIIKNHGGAIEVESSAADGTTFTIRLPIEGV